MTELEMNIKRLSEGKMSKNFEMENIVWGNVENLLLKYGFVFDDGMEMNGYQNDYWVTIYKDDLEYELSGSMYYGNFEVGMVK